MMVLATTQPFTNAKLFPTFKPLCNPCQPCPLTDMLMVEGLLMGDRASEKTVASWEEDGVVADGTGLEDSDICMGLLGLGLATGGVVLISVAGRDRRRRRQVLLIAHPPSHHGGSLPLR